MTSHCVNMLGQKKLHLPCLIPFLIGKNIVMVQIVILITSSPSGAGFYVMRWIKYGGW